MRTIQQDYTINAPISEVWRAFTTAEMAEQWGASPAKVNASEGGEFSYWDGDIHGTTTKIEVEKLLEQDWYEHDHPERLHKVTFTFEAADADTTKIHLAQTDVGDDEFASMADGWADYYFDPMKALLEKAA
jgi:uncharacterized protein YndB with AHSA1/START domain